MNNQTISYIIGRRAWQDVLSEFNIAMNIGATYRVELAVEQCPGVFCTFQPPKVHKLRGISAPETGVDSIGPH
ncbi:hypothetical protein M433DRAFT_10290 [Acidomyces richmondensis BFW]|nr:hypothetical protein M433DRAFT_10290 [Acidomyces richmondensis BFW]